MIKSTVLLCTTLLIASACAQDAAIKVVDLQAPQAIALVHKETIAAKADPKKPPLIVLDVRNADEYAQEHITGAKNLDFHDPSFKEALAKLDKSSPYLVHCAAGGRSAKTRDLMKSLGFKNVFHLEGGLKAWKKAGGPLTAPAQP